MAVINLLNEKCVDFIKKLQNFVLTRDRVCPKYVEKISQTSRKFTLLNMFFKTGFKIKWTRSTKLLMFLFYLSITKVEYC